MGLTFISTGIFKIAGYPHIVTVMTDGFAETWLPDFLLVPFFYVLPWIETTVGALTLLGLFTRPVLYVMGLLLVIINFGLSVQGNFTTALNNIPYFIIIGLDIILLNYNKYSLDNLFFGKKSQGASA